MMFIIASIFALLTTPLTMFKNHKIGVLVSLLVNFVIFFGLENIFSYFFLTQQVLSAKFVVMIFYGVLAFIFHHLESGTLYNSAMDDDSSIIQKSILIATITIASLVVIGFGVHSVVSSQDKYDAVPVKEKKEMAAFDEDTKPISVPIGFAENKMKKSFGQVPNSSFYKLGDLQIQYVNDEIVYVAPVEFSGFFKWNKEKRSPGYFTLSATDSSANPKLVKFEMEYLPSAFFSKDVDRAIYQHDKSLLFKGENQFEIDEDGNAYFMRTYGKFLKPATRVGFVPEGIILLNAQTGETTQYTLDETPDWIDAPISSETASYQHGLYGKLVHGFWNSILAKKDVIYPSENGNETGMTPVFLNQKMYYFSDFTSPKDDIDSMMGYSLQNARTGEITFYSGQENTSLMDSSGAMEVTDKKFVEKQWSSAIPILYNFDGEASWYVSVVDSNGFLQQIAIVSAENTEYFVSGTNPEQVLEQYKTLLKNKTNFDVNAASEQPKQTIETVIDRVYKERVSENTFVYLIDEQGTMFLTSSENNPEVVFIESGDSVKIEYTKTTPYNTVVSIELTLIEDTNTTNE